MKFQKPLNEILRNLSHVKVLRVLVNSELDLTGNQVAGLAGISPLGCKNTLDHLRELNLLAVRRVGRAYLYRLREENIIVNNLLKSLFVKEKELLKVELEKIAQNFSGMAHSVYLFGSVAREEETFQSDIDLLVVARDKQILNQTEEKALEMTDYLTGTTGITPTILVMTKEDFTGKYKSGDPLVKNVVVEGIILYGSRNLN